ncbi:MAG: hypothetical protein PHE83_06335 [Opitutaceae bacterium]|nr:hypothetical protein [Opitutaceae bacterium]
MSKPRKSTIEVQGTVITILTRKEQDFISLTDMAKKFGDDCLPELARSATAWRSAETRLFEPVE